MNAVLPDAVLRARFKVGWSVALLIAASLFSVGCGGSPSHTTTTTTPPITTTPTAYPSTPAETISWTAATSVYPAPAADDPANAVWGTGSTDFPLTVSNPTANASVTSPFNLVATASPTTPIFFMRVYVDNISVYYTSSGSINTQIFAAPGNHTVLIMAEAYDCPQACNSGVISATPVNITVSAQSKATLSDIQTLPGWQSCSANFPAGVQRAGQLCAAGESTFVPVSSLTMNSAPPAPAPAMDGKSAKFSMAPGTVAPDPSAYQYSNYLYFNPIAGGNGVSNFVYDLYFWIDNVNAPQALEFDVNQGFDDTTATPATSKAGVGNPIRFVWGSECNLHSDSPPGQWDIWDDSLGLWKATGIPCKANEQILPNTWNHLTWNLHQMAGTVYYDTLTLNGVVYTVNGYATASFPYQTGWTLEEIDTAFQMDLDNGGLNKPPDAYNVWLDQVSLTAY